MSTVDLFGNVTPEKTKEQKYREYINSPEWKKKSKALIESVGKCQKCGFSKYARKLEVHHLTYEHFKNEPPEDLIVVCSKCHKIKDRQREKETEKRNYEKLEDARFEGWARAVYGDDWMVYNDEYVVYQEFQEWLEDKGEW